MAYTDYSSIERYVNEGSADQYPVVIRRYPIHSVILHRVQRVSKMFCVLPFTIAILFRIPDVLRVIYRTVFSIFWMVFNNEEESFPIRGNCWPYFRQFTVYT